MAAEILTPTCEVTGLPLPILPPEPRDFGALLVSRPPDRHHHFHPAKDPILTTVGGKAVRNCRIQKVNFDLHHRAYHGTFAGPELPVDEDDMFRISIMAAAGVVPRQALKIHELNDWEVAWMNDKQHRQISRSIDVDQPNVLARFFSHYAVKQGIENVIDERCIDEFLDSNTKRARRHEIARLMVREALGISISSLNLAQQHKELKERGLIAQAKPKTFQWVATKLVRMKHIDYFSQLAHEQLAST